MPKRKDAPMAGNPANACIVADFLKLKQRYQQQGNQNMRRVVTNALASVQVCPLRAQIAILLSSPPPPQAYPMPITSKDQALKLSGIGPSLAERIGKTLAKVQMAKAVVPPYAVCLPPLPYPPSPLASHALLPRRPL
jgi:hypothetical protein